MLPRYLQRAFFQRLCVFFNMLMRGFFYTADKLNVLRNNSAWGLYFELNLCLLLLPRPRRGLRGIVFTRSVCVCVCVSVCLCVYLCVRPIFWYFIARLLEEISI